MNRIKSYIFGHASAIVCLAAFTFSYTSVYAQDEAEETTSEEVVAPVKKAQAPQYEMKTISGYVYDAATKEPMDGARVQAYNNRRYSVMTDEKGMYTMQVPVFVQSLYITVPEYNPVQVAFDGEKVQDVGMFSDKFKTFYTPETGIDAQKSLNVDLSSAISIDNEIENNFSGDIHTINRSGMSGQGVAMFLRGINSLNTSSQPLIILDGMMMDLQLDRVSIHDGFFSNILSGIDVEDIESVQVLKNATALYGSRGANGVIVINTKRGHSMATKINASIFGGFETTPSSLKMMNGSQYKNYVSELIGTTEQGMKSTTSSTSIPFLNDNPDYYWYPMYHNNTDWQDGLYRTAFSQNYKVNVQGGDEIAMYSLSLGYANSQSTAKDTGFDRLNIRFNTDINLALNLYTQLDVAYSRLTNTLRDNGWAEDYESSTISSPNVLGLIQSPFLSKYGYYTGDDLKLYESRIYAGKYTDDDNYPFSFASRFGVNAALANPYWIIQNGEGTNKNFQEVTQFVVNAQPRWEINEHFTLSNRFSYMLNRNSEKYYLPENGTPIYNLEGLGDVTSVIKSLFGKETSVYEDARIAYKQNFGAHDVSAFGGFRFTSNSYTDSYMTGYDSGNDKMPDNKNSNKFRSVGGTNDAWKNIAWYAHGNYSYKNTYFAEATLTAESSSRFGHDAAEGIKAFNVNWGIFPSLQLGWVISNEKWMQPFTAVNNLKFTVGYDESGNDNIDYSASRTYFKSSAFLKTAIALKMENIENPEIQWETTRSWNFALSGSFFKNRLQAGVDFYIRNTSNLLTKHAVNYMSGLTSYWCNSGALRNTGIEGNFNAILINNRNFKWQLGASLGHYKNEVTKLPEGDYTTNVYGAEMLTAKGGPVAVFYGYKTNGVFSTTEEASTYVNGTDYLKFPTGLKNRPYQNYQAGDIRFVDLDGNGIIDEKDKTVIGDPNPSIYGNIFSSFFFGKHWTLDLNFKYSLGNDIYNYQRSQLESLNGFYNQTQAAVNRWTCEGQVTDVPRAVSTTSELWVNNERFSDRWIEDGSYLKMKKVRLSYNLPLSLSWIQGVTVWGECNNVFTLTKYSGLDPEFAVTNGTFYQGIDAGMLPSSRSFNVGVRFNL